MPFFIVAISGNFLFRLLADIGENTTIDIEHVAIDSIRSLGSQEYGRTTKLRRIEPASGRCFGTDEAVERMTAAVWLNFAQRSGLWCGDITWTYTIALYVMLTKF